MKKLTLAIALILIPVGVLAASAASVNVTRLKSGSSFKILDGIALNATTANRTVDVDIGADWAKVVLFVDYTYSAATTVVATPSCSPDGTIYFDYTSRAISAGASTVSSLVDTYAVSADSSFLLEYDVRTCKKLKVVLSGASAGGSDLVDVYVSVAVGE